MLSKICPGNQKSMFEVGGPNGARTPGPHQNLQNLTFLNNSSNFMFNSSKIIYFSPGYQIFKKKVRNPPVFEIQGVKGTGCFLQNF